MRAGLSVFNNTSLKTQDPFISFSTCSIEKRKKKKKTDVNILCRRINVTGFGDKSACHPTVAPQKYYVIFCERRSDGLVAKFDDVFGAAAEWSERTEERIWSGVGKFAYSLDRA